MTVQKQWSELDKFSEELHSKSPYGIRLVTTHGVFLNFNGVYGWEDDFYIDLIHLILFIDK